MVCNVCVVQVSGDLRVDARYFIPTSPGISPRLSGAGEVIVREAGTQFRMEESVGAKDRQNFDLELNGNIRQQ